MLTIVWPSAKDMSPVSRAFKIEEESSGDWEVLGKGRPSLVAVFGPNRLWQ